MSDVEKVLKAQRAELAQQLTALQKKNDEMQAKLQAELERIDTFLQGSSTAPKKQTKKAASKKAAKATSTGRPVGRPRKEKAPAASNGEGRITLEQRLIDVMQGYDEISIPEIAGLLEAQGWKPKSQSVNTYLSYTLSSHKDTFARVNRGTYCLKAKAKVSPSKVNGKPTTKATAGKDDPSLSVEKGISDLGDDVGDNPFI